MPEHKIKPSNPLATAADLALHFTVTSALAWYFFLRTGGWLWPALCFTGGVLVDLDHLIDYFRYYGLHFDLKEFFSHRHLERGKVRLVFHSWELVMLFWLLSAKISYFLPLAAGMTGHMMIDQFTFHRESVFFYFLIYRWHHRFDLRVLKPHVYLDWEEKREA